MNSNSQKSRYLLREWGENYPPKKDFISQIQGLQAPKTRDSTKAVIWQVYGKSESLYFKMFCYSILSHLKWSNLMNFDTIVYMSPCFVEEHRSMIEALKLIGIRVVEVKEIRLSKYYIFMNFEFEYDKVLLIDCDMFIVNKLDLNLYWDTTYHISSDKPSAVQLNSWALWPNLITTKTRMQPDEYMNLIYEFFGNRYERSEFDEMLNYVEWINNGHAVVDCKLLRDKDFVDFLKFSSINNIESDEITLLMAAKLLKYQVGYNKPETLVNPTFSEEIYSKTNYSIHLNGLSFDKDPKFVDVFTKILTTK